MEKEGEALLLPPLFSRFCLSISSLSFSRNSIFLCFKFFLVASLLVEIHRVHLLMGFHSLFWLLNSRLISCK
ncbi:hypothetical protein L6164_034103 [Bauhinia variegata]|uniref:Uncharacterized protein n=1 Tax=Bauhinia variegata TaxID=167791 RepID=A0ACB9KU76_BAUVA|nr:hypothetical protein L6164_034103 [Bauhinia variegata]